MKKFCIVMGLTLAGLGFAGAQDQNAPYYQAQRQNRDVGISTNAEGRALGRAVGKPAGNLGKWLASIFLGIPEEFGNTTAGFIEGTVKAVPKVTHGTGKGINKYLGDKVGDDR